MTTNNAGRGAWGQADHTRDDARECFLGVDLGQSKDFTALAMVQRITRSVLHEDGTVRSDTVYHLRRLERVPLLTRYPAIIRGVQQLMSTPPLSEDSHLVVDKTGVGAAILDMFREAGMTAHAITIHGGDAVTREYLHDRVPKRDLVGTLLKLYQTHRLEVAQESPFVETLTQELVNFQIKINLATGHDSYEAWRESVHDDLVLATALACWYAENEPAGIEPLDDDIVAALHDSGRYW